MTTTMTTPGGPQQQPQTQPQVVVVQQPIVTTARKRAPPYILRGARFSNGCNMPGQAIIFFITLGGILTFMGLPSGFSTGLTAVYVGFLLFGGVFLVSGIWLCVKAKRQYNALPPDHIDRLKYNSGYPLPITTINNATTFTFPTAGGTAGYMGVTPGQAPGYPGQAPGYPVQAPGYPSQAPSYPGQAGQTTYAYPPSGHPGYPSGAQGSGPGMPSAPSGSQDTFKPASAPPLHPSFNDDPPPYSEIMKESYKQ